MHVECARYVEAASIKHGIRRKYCQELARNVDTQLLGQSRPCPVSSPVTSACFSLRVFCRPSCGRELWPRSAFPQQTKIPCLSPRVCILSCRYRTVLVVPLLFLLCQNERCRKSRSAMTRQTRLESATRQTVKGFIVRS